MSSFHATLSSSPATHVPGHLNTDSDRDDISEVDAEDDWFGNPQDVQPGTSASSKVSKARNDEVHLWTLFRVKTNFDLIACFVAGTGLEPWTHFFPSECWGGYSGRRHQPDTGREQ